MRLRAALATVRFTCLTPCGGALRLTCAVCHAGRMRRALLRRCSLQRPRRDRIRTRCPRTSFCLRCWRRRRASRAARRCSAPPSVRFARHLLAHYLLTHLLIRSADRRAGARGAAGPRRRRRSGRSAAAGRRRKRRAPFARCRRAARCAARLRCALRVRGRGCRVSSAGRWHRGACLRGPASSRRRLSRRRCRCVGRPRRSSIALRRRTAGLPSPPGFRRIRARIAAAACASRRRLRSVHGACFAAAVCSGG